MQLSCAKTWTVDGEQWDGKEKGIKAGRAPSSTQSEQNHSYLLHVWRPCKSSLGEMSLLLEGKKGEEEKRMKRKTFEKKAHDPRPL